MPEEEKSPKPLHMINSRCVFKGCEGEAIWTFELGVFNICLCGEHGPIGFDMMGKFEKSLKKLQRDGER